MKSIQGDWEKPNFIGKLSIEIQEIGRVNRKCELKKLFLELFYNLKIQYLLKIINFREYMKALFWKILSILVAMYISISLFYFLGFENINVQKKSNLKINREFDFALFKINEETAFSISKSKYISIVKYKRGLVPFCYLCGEFEPDGTIVNGIGYKNNDWYYTDLPNPFSEAYNIQTNESIDISEKDFQDENLEGNELFKQKQLSINENQKIDDTYIIKNFPPLSTLNESCIIFNAAFLILIGSWIIVGIFIVIFKSVFSI